MDQEEHFDEFAKLESNYRSYLEDLLQQISTQHFLTLRDDAFHLWLGLQDVQVLHQTLKKFEELELYEQCIIIKQYIDEYGN